MGTRLHGRDELLWFECGPNIKSRAVGFKHKFMGRGPKVGSQGPTYLCEICGHNKFEDTYFSLATKGKVKHLIPFGFEMTPNQHVQNMRSSESEQKEKCA